MCVTFVTCEVRVCGLRCRKGSSLYIYRVYLLSCEKGARLIATAKTAPNSKGGCPGMDRCRNENAPQHDPPRGVRRSRPE